MAFEIPSPLVAWYTLLHTFPEASNRSLHRFFSFFGRVIDGTDHDKGDLDRLEKNDLLTALEVDKAQYIDDS